MRIRKEYSKAIVPAIVILGENYCDDKCPFLNIKSLKRREIKCLLFHEDLDAAELVSDKRIERCIICQDKFGK